MAYTNDDADFVISLHEQFGAGQEAIQGVTLPLEWMRRVRSVLGEVLESEPEDKLKNQIKGLLPKELNEVIRKEGFVSVHYPCFGGGFVRCRRRYPRQRR